MDDKQGMKKTLGELMDRWRVTASTLAREAECSESTIYKLRRRLVEPGVVLANRILAYFRRNYKYGAEIDWSRKAKP